ncbi:hypothetical protein CANTEDRAFT_130074 [Yamadazyma tenuis ATCC 10573]|uniref:RRM domain-containing protein n=1 Tax=Candida tenuis (strain ATCC 10573 / BCRC 21748 / CBS 615 / JCM 9827 / NBRC 10315 / NRRL Y-1498 / VKM Y-70) TaxID=590646 RepID=G3B187_CANTC|nr:uncharacterized protein CANTEDRAFT_130074 [Yamadazyma tenuis ATCC 10573]EGV64907.1 hypothetical protein CANTEDRAFT_130074 [Yamadazyma tenuis ATCC 10573]
MSFNPQDSRKRPYNSTQAYDSRDSPARSQSYGGYQNGRQSGGGGTRGGFQGRRNDRPEKSNSLQLWMGDLDSSWNEETIISIWNSLGEAPLNVKLIRDREDPTGRGKPLYCFVSFANEASIASAFSKNGSSVPGTDKRLKLNYATGSGSGSSSTITSNDRFNRKPQDDFSLMISGLELDTTEGQVFDAFNSRYPNSVRQVKIIVDTTTGVSRGFGFAKFNSSATQQIVCKEMNGFILNGKPISLGSTVSGVNSRNQDVLSDSVDLNVIQLPQAQPKLSKYSDPENTCIEVSGLSARFTESEVECYFLSFGDIISLTISKNFDSCSIRYRIREDAEAAILLMNSFTINDCQMRVTWGEPKVQGSKLNTNLSQRCEIPRYLGKGPLTRFDKMSPEEIKQWKPQVHEMSEPAPSMYHSYIEDEDSLPLQLL